MFLTGGRKELYALVVKGFKLGLDFGDDAGPSEGIITHSTRFVLIDGAGKIRGYYHGTEQDMVDQVLLDLRALGTSGDSA